MTNERILAIDLGSAFTKIAVRRDWDVRASILTGLPLADEDEICIPSVVVRVNGKGASHWVIGAEAASQIPGTHVEIFNYWKRALYHPSVLNGESVETVGTEFFKGIKRVFASWSGGGELARLPIRICLPKLDGDESAQAKVGRMAVAAGFRLTAERPFVYEPASNLLGMLTEGRNQTYYDATRRDFEEFRPGRRMRLDEMLESRLCQALGRGSNPLTIFVVDVGAFTTDVARVTVPTGFPNGWDELEVAQRSFELGIAELDEYVLEALAPDAQQMCRALSPARWEYVKRILYAGREAQLPLAGHKPIRVGVGAEKLRIGEAVSHFSGRILERSIQFSEEIDGHIYGTYLTGGGMSIANLRVALTTTPQKTVLRMKCLLDEQRPLRSREDELHNHRLFQLSRGASAIGACSVFFH